VSPTARCQRLNSILMHHNVGAGGRPSCSLTAVCEGARVAARLSPKQMPPPVWWTLQNDDGLRVVVIGIEPSRENYGAASAVQMAATRAEPTGCVRSNLLG